MAAKKAPEGAVFIEGYRPGTKFRNGKGCWVNGTPISAAMADELKKSGYKLRSASESETVTDYVPVLANVSEKRPGPRTGATEGRGGKVADSRSTALEGDGGDEDGDEPQE